MRVANGSVCPISNDPFTSRRQSLPSLLNLNRTVEAKALDASKLHISTIISQPFGENTYVVWLAGRSDCVVVDPGMEPDKIFEHLEAHGLTAAAIAITHGHSDHIAGNTAIKQRFPDCRIVIGRGDASKLTDGNENLSIPFGFEILSPAADELLDDGQTVELAGMAFEVLETPGHCAGHVSYLLKIEQPWVVLCGDVIFAGSVGRTDFPDGDFDQLVATIRTKLFTLADDTVLLSGHGPQTTVGVERRTNPFVGER